MPQYPLNLNAKTPGGGLTLYNVDNNGNLYVAPAPADQAFLGETVSGVIATGPVYLNSVNVIGAGSVAGSVNDTTAVSLSGSANAVWAIPTVPGAYDLHDFPIKQGLVINTGGATISGSYRTP